MRCRRESGDFTRDSCRLIAAGYKGYIRAIVSLSLPVFNDDTEKGSADFCELYLLSVICLPDPNPI